MLKKEQLEQIKNNINNYTKEELFNLLLIIEEKKLYEKIENEYVKRLGGK